MARACLGVKKLKMEDEEGEMSSTSPPFDVNIYVQMVSPLDPLTIIIACRIVLWSYAYGGVGFLTQKEPVKEGFHFRVLHFGKLAVSMTCHDGITNAIGNAKALPHLDGCVG